MPGCADLVELATHMEWADAMVWNVVLGSEAARSDRRVVLWLYHIHTVQHAFVQVWRGETPRFREPSEFADPRLLSEWGREGHREIQMFLGDLTADQLTREIRFPWAGEIAATLKRELHHPTLAQAATQIAMHSVHHRAQVNARLRELGAGPPVIDYIAWIWWGQPEGDWEFLGA
jgi:uncharacterized damage-inducible protein DinB